MALITLPTKFGFSRIERFALTRESNLLRSRFTGQTQRVVYPFAVWEIEGKLLEYDGEEAAIIRGFFAQLEGVGNTFKLPVPGYTAPRSGNITTDTTVNLAVAVRATSVNLAIGAGKTLSAGDYFTIQDELKIITVGKTGSGIVQFQPPLRKAAALGVPVTLINPYCLMHAVEDDVARWGLQAPVRHGLELAAVEAIDI